MTDGCKLLFIATSTGTLSVLPVKYNPAVVGHCIKIYLDTEFFFFVVFFFFLGGGGWGGGGGVITFISLACKVMRRGCYVDVTLIIL